MTLVEKQQRLAEDLAVIPDPHERLNEVVIRARRAPPLSDAERIDANRVRGCVSAVWLVGEVRDGRCYFRADADGPLVKGLVTFLCEFFSGATPAEIVATEANPLAALGLIRNLSPTRQNGLASALATIRAFSAGQAGNH
ncbi:MAG: sufE [Verrucomicrobia bacterium]|nr:sufE [Verrucomicrobiota bacterium]